MQYLDETNQEDLFAGKYNICFWLWETDALPESWISVLSMADEIWCPSEYICNTMKRYTDKPVRKFIYPIQPSVNQQYDKTFFGLEEGLTWFLCMFDVQSTMERKNPLGAVRAYIDAFTGNDDKTGLVIKINNPNETVMTCLLQETSGIKNIKIVSEPFDKMRINSLISCCDVLISLHRAEGFGLPIAEAMYFGKPVVATNYSANAEFMTPDNSCPVAYTLVDIPAAVPHYGGHGRWAEPDHGHAVEYLRALAKDAPYRERMGNTAAKTIQTCYSLQNAIQSVRR